MAQLKLSAVLLATSCLAFISAHGQADVPPPTALSEAPCAINKVENNRANAAAGEGRALADRKGDELIDPENRADRANNRLNKGQNVTWEGGSSHHRLSLDLPTVTARNETKSFDFVETYMGEMKTKVPHLETCWWTVHVGFVDVKTKGTCVRDGWLVTNVPMFRNKHVEFSLPSSVEIGHRTQEFSYDLPTITMRDNRADFEHAKADVERIKRELDAGKAAIAERQMALLDNDITKVIDGVEKDTFTAFDQNVAAQMATFEQKRAQLVADRYQARSAYASAKDPHGADAAFAQAFMVLDRAQADAKASFDQERQQIATKIAEMRKNYLTDHNTPSCLATQKKTDEQS